MKRFLACVLGMAIVLAGIGCDENSVGGSSDGQMQINLKLASAELAEQLAMVRVTVWPAEYDGTDESPLADTTVPLVDNSYYLVMDAIPTGTVLVVVEASDEYGRVIYRGEAMVVVRAGDAAETEVVLAPAVELVRLNPRYQAIDGGESFTLTMEIFETPEWQGIDAWLSFDSDLLLFDSAQVGRSLTGISAEFEVTSGRDWVRLSILAAEPLIIVGDGYVVEAAQMYFTGRNPSEVPVSTYISIDSASITQGETAPIQEEPPYLDGATIDIETEGKDQIAPATIVDLAVDSINQTQAFLSWTATGDDHSTGIASIYQLRYSSSTITLAGWGEATPIPNLPNPAAAGTTQQFTVEGIDLSDPIYFALRVVDDAGNWSGVSNVVMTQAPDIASPATVSDLRVVSFDDVSITLAWTAVGDDGNTGTAASYDIRHYHNEMTFGNFDSATSVTGEPQPAQAGTVETFQITMATAVPTYFAMIVADEVGNISDISNNALYTPPDSVPPAQVVDLEAVEVTAGSATLSWTAPGDDGDEGTASEYEILYDTSPIDSSNYPSASVFTPPFAPSAAGSAETATVDVLASGTRYYMVLRTADELGNWSHLSNDVVITTPDTTSPAAVGDLELLDYTRNSATLQWTAPGDDGSTGTATAYELRYAFDTISDATWEEATALQLESAPQAAGTVELQTVTLPGPGVYYLALRAWDESENQSGLSNNVDVPMIIVSIPDIQLKNSIRAATGVSTGNLIAKDLAAIDTLNIDSSNVADLTGMEYCTGLVYFSAYGNLLTSVQPLENSTLMEWLNLYQNQITNIGPIAGMTELHTLNVSYNQISSINALADLTNLRNLSFWWNQVEDVTAIATMTGLDTLLAGYNAILNIEAFVDNEGFQSGDYIDISGNWDLDAESIENHIPALEDRGVTVYWGE